jgi:hypothetical protein
MKVHIDEHRFDDLQMELGYAIADEIHTVLKKAGVPDGERLEELVAEALFHIGCVVDGSREVKGADGPMQAVLTFRMSEHNAALISAGGTSWIHEYAFGIAEDYFNQRRARPAKREEPRKTPLEALLGMVRDIAEAFTRS